jgi:hypothetical protein
MKDLDIASNFMFDTASYSRGTTIKRMQDAHLQ